METLLTPPSTACWHATALEEGAVIRRPRGAHCPASAPWPRGRCWLTEPFAIARATINHLTCIRNNSALGFEDMRQPRFSEDFFSMNEWMSRWFSEVPRWLLNSGGLQRDLGEHCKLSPHQRALPKQGLLSCTVQGEMVWVSLLLKGKRNWGTKGHGPPVMTSLGEMAARRDELFTHCYGGSWTQIWSPAEDLAWGNPGRWRQRPEEQLWRDSSHLPSALQVKPQTTSDLVTWLSSGGISLPVLAPECHVWRLTEASASEGYVSLTLGWSVYRGVNQL